ncbi:MAG: Na/Pi cotransporter family protein [Phycisphaeraceae bacterium]
MALFLTIAGGVALIIYGARVLQKGLDRVFGGQLSRWMQRMAHSRGRAFALGLAVSLLAPSSTTISVLAVQAVQAGYLTARKMLAVMLGANLGMTIMVILIALRLETYAPVLVLLGVLIYQFGRTRAMHGLGQIVLALGLIFLALDIIRGVGEQFEPEDDFVQLMRIAQHYPFWMAIFAAGLAIALQSSTAAIGLMIALAAAGMVGLPLAVPVVVGANVGLAVNTLLVGWGAGLESRRLGLGNLLTKSATGLLVLAALPLVLAGLERVPVELDKQIAIAHTGFNVVMAVLFLPAVDAVYAMLCRLAPEREDEAAFGPRYITQRPPQGASLATGQSMREILRVSEIVRSMLTDLWRALVQRDMDLARQVQQRDDEVDLLDGAIKRYLSQVASQEGQEGQSVEVMRQLRYLAELETIGDVIDKNLAELVLKRIRKDINFSPEGWEELNDFYQKVEENMLIAETAFATRDKSLAEQLLRHKGRLSDYERALRDRHFYRLRSGQALTHESSAVHLDLLTHLKRINAAVTHVAYAVLQYDEQAAPAAVRPTE